VVVSESSTSKFPSKDVCRILGILYILAGVWSLTVFPSFVLWISIFPFSASIYFAKSGKKPKFQNKWLCFFLSEKWLYFAAAIALFHSGQFAREEISPLPWVAFQDVISSHGVFNGASSFVNVCTTDLWLFWNLGQFCLIGQRDRLDGGKIKLIRIVNILMGLLLVTSHNPIYKLIRY